MSIQIRRGPVAADNFSIISNTLIRDNSISLQARGLLVWLLSHREDFSLTMERIAAMTGAGVTRVRTAIAELEEAGYLVREQRRALGRFSDELYHVTDCPVRPSVDFPPTDSPHTENTVYGESPDIRKPPSIQEDHFPEEDHSSSGDDVADSGAVEASVAGTPGLGAQRPLFGATASEALERRQDEKTGHDLPTSGFDAFWALWPRKQRKQDAVSAWRKAVRLASAGDEQTGVERIMVTAAQYAAYVKASATQPRFVQQAVNWLNGRGWLNDYPVADGSAATGEYHRVTAKQRDAWDEFYQQHDDILEGNT